MEQPEITLADDERQRVEVYTRVMGYHRPVDSFNIGKKGEFAERLPFCTQKVELALRAPRPPHELVDALQDRIHPASGRLVAATPVRISCMPSATGETTGYTAGTAT